MLKLESVWIVVSMIKILVILNVERLANLSQWNVLVSIQASVAAVQMAYYGKNARRER